VIVEKRGITRKTGALGLALLLAAVLSGCTRRDAPAPVVMGTMPKPHSVRPSGSATRPAFNGDRPSSVVVQRGETLYSIARRFDVPIRTVIEANNLPPPYYLVVGQNLKIPQVKQYVVQSGDTLKTVSRHFGVDASTLAATNKLAAPYGLRSGQALILPAPVQAPLLAPPAASAAAPPATKPTTTAPVMAPVMALAQPPKTAYPIIPLPHPEPARLEEKKPENKRPEDKRPEDKKPVAIAAKPPAVPAAPHVLTLPTPSQEEPQMPLVAPPEQPVPQPASASQQAQTLQVPTQQAALTPRKEAEEAEEPTEPAPEAHSAVGFQWPVRGPVLTGFGVGPTGTQNDGINLAAALGAPVAAANDGEVAYVGNELRGYGNLILLKHADGWMTAYAHCDGLAVKAHDHVKRGQIIARVGKTGAVAEPQLHFEIRRGSRALDPANYLPSLASAR